MERRTATFDAGLGKEFDRFLKDVGFNLNFRETADA